MKLQADAHKLMMELQAKLGGCDHSCRPKCKVCAARGREKEAREKREWLSKTYEPDGQDPFRGFRER